MLCIPQPSDDALRSIFGTILNGFLSKGFQDAIKKIGDNIVAGTIEIYRTILKEKPPIPKKFHYTFNLRDVSKVFQGLLMSRFGSIREQDQMIKLWIHECCRIFQDRLIDDEDRVWFGKLIEDIASRNFKSKWSYEDIFINNKIYFSDLLRIDHPNRDYEEITQMPKLVKLLEDKLFEFNMDGNNRMNLVFFTDCIEHILRIARILRQPRGNAMLIGVGGSGKQSLTNLARYILGCDLSRIELRTNYGDSDFRGDIQKMMLLAGQEGKNLVFLFNDSQIAKESFLESINSILNSGEVPNLWEPEQRDKIISDLRPYTESLGRSSDADTIYRTFVERVRNNMHIVLCMSPIGDALRNRCLQFPSLVDCCTLDWFSPWPHDALLSVSQKILTQQMEGLNEDLKLALADMCPDVHLSAASYSERFFNELRRKVYNTPKSYLDLLNLFMSIYEEKRDELLAQEKKLSSGITKLEHTKKVVAELQIIIVELQPQLEKQAEVTQQALVAVEADKGLAREKNLIVEKETEEVNKKKLEIKLVSDAANAELEKALPELIATKESLKNLNEDDFVMIKTMPNPPTMFKTVMSAVSSLFGTNETDWNEMKKLMSNVKEFKDKLANYDTANISTNRIMKLQKYLPELKIEDAKKVSGSLVLLCQWCLSMNRFSIVYKNVEPKQQRAKLLQAKLDEANAALAQKEAELNEVKAKVEKLDREYQEKMNL